MDDTPIRVSWYTCCCTNEPKQKKKPSGHHTNSTACMLVSYCSNHDHASFGENSVKQILSRLLQHLSKNVTYLVPAESPKRHTSTSEFSTSPHASVVSYTAKTSERGKTGWYASNSTPYTITLRDHIGRMQRLENRLGTPSCSHHNTTVEVVLRVILNPPLKTDGNLHAPHPPPGVHLNTIAMATQE